MEPIQRSVWFESLGVIMFGSNRVGIQKDEDENPTVETGSNWEWNCSRTKKVCSNS